MVVLYAGCGPDPNGDQIARMDHDRARQSQRTQRGRLSDLGACPSRINDQRIGTSIGQGPRLENTSKWLVAFLYHTIQRAFCDYYYW